MSGGRLPVILALGTTQTLAWASSVYLPALVADWIGARFIGESFPSERWLVDSTGRVTKTPL